jgi:hypothetical protein
VQLSDRRQDAATAADDGCPIQDPAEMHGVLGDNLEYSSQHELASIQFCSNIEGFETPIVMCADPDLGITDSLLVRIFLSVLKDASEKAKELYLTGVAAPYLETLDRMIISAEKRRKTGEIKRLLKTKADLLRYASLSSIGDTFENNPLFLHGGINCAVATNKFPWETNNNARR